MIWHAFPSGLYGVLIWMFCLVCADTKRCIQIEVGEIPVVNRN